MYICIYLYMYVRMYIYIRTCEWCAFWPGIPIRIHVYIYTCVYTYINTYIYTYVRIHVPYWRFWMFKIFWRSFAGASHTVVNELIPTKSTVSNTETSSNATLQKKKAAPPARRGDQSELKAEAFASTVYIHAYIRTYLHTSLHTYI